MSLPLRIMKFISLFICIAFLSACGGGSSNDNDANPSDNGSSNEGDSQTEKVKVELNSSPEEGGSVKGQGTYEKGKGLTVEAIPATGYQFVRWEQGGTKLSQDARYEIEATETRTLVAIFSPKIDAVQVSSEVDEVPKFTKAEFSATLIYETGGTKDITSEANWSSSDPEVAAVTTESDGSVVVDGKTEGASTIKAEHQGEVGATKVTVTSPVLTTLEIAPQDAELALGETVDIEATGEYKGGVQQNVTSKATWASKNSAVAKLIENESVESKTIASVANGATTVEATFQSISDTAGISVTSAALTQISISPESKSIKAGKVLQLKAEGTFTDRSTKNLTDNVAWSSSDEELASISEDGVISALKAGDVSLTASQDSFSASAALTIVTAPSSPRQMSLVADPNVILANGSDSATINATVIPNDPKNNVVADGTEVSLSAEGSTLNLSSVNENTVSEEVSVNAQSDGPTGKVNVSAEVKDTLARAQTAIEVVNSFSEVITSSQSTSIVNINGVIQSGSELSYTITNSSNRDFDLDEFEFLIDGQSDIVTNDPEILSQNTLDGGQSTGVTIMLSRDSRGPFVGVFKLKVPSTSDCFKVRIECNCSTPDLPGVGLF